MNNVFAHINNVFVAFGRWTADHEREQVLEHLRSPRESGMPLPTPPGQTFHDSREIYQETFAQCGGWAEWIDYIATGIDIMTRLPKFYAVVCPDKTVGKATAQIVQRALTHGKPVYSLVGKDLVPVTAVGIHDQENWKDGWYLINRRNENEEATTR